ADIGARVRRNSPAGGRQNGEGMLERERIGLRAAFLLLPSHDQREILLPAEPADRPSGLGFGPAGYDAHDSIVRAEGIECARLDERGLFRDEAVPILAAVPALEFVDHTAERYGHARVRDDGVRKLPVVVEPARILVTLDGAGQDSPSGELLDGFFDRAAI